jgi:hypothetical protein
MEHRGELRTVIMEDVGVVMDQQGVGSHVRLLLLILLHHSDPSISREREIRTHADEQWTNACAFMQRRMHS